MPPIRNWPEWVKAGLIAAASSLVTVFGMGMTEGARRADADTSARMVRDHEPRIQALERDRAAVDEWKSMVKTALDDVKADLREIKTDLRAIHK